MTSHPSAIMSLNESSMNRWKVAGELLRPKNITVGSNSPLWVIKAAFHWSPSQMRIVVVSPSDVKFGEDLGIFYLIDEILD